MNILEFQLSLRELIISHPQKVEIWLIRLGTSDAIEKKLLPVYEAVRVY